MDSLLTSLAAASAAAAAVLVFGVLFYISFIFLSQAKTTKPNNGHFPLPPGNTGWPIIGEMLNFLSASRNGRPESFFRERMRIHSPNVFLTSILGVKMATLCGPGGNKLAFSHDEKKLVSWWPPTLYKIVYSKGSKLAGTTKVRDSLSQFLRPESLRKFVPIMDDYMRKFMDSKLVTNQVINAVPLLDELVFALSCKIFMNVEDQTQVARLLNHFNHIASGFLSMPIDFPGTSFRRGMNAANKIREEFYPIIKQRISCTQSANPEQISDFFTVCGASSGDHDQVFLNEIVDSFLIVLVASHDTTVSAMSSVVYFLADHPHVFQQVMEEQNEIAKSKDAGELLNWDDLNKMKNSRSVMNEVLRLVPPVNLAFRQATNDVTYAGFTIPKGWKIMWSAHTTHKDPKCFENPEEFNPARFDGKTSVPYSFVPFGMGPHMCTGSEYARIEILIFIHNLVTRFQWEKIISDEKINFFPFPLPAKGLPIRLLPHDR